MNYEKIKLNARYFSAGMNILIIPKYGSLKRRTIRKVIELKDSHGNIVDHEILIDRKNNRYFSLSAIRDNNSWVVAVFKVIK